MGTWVKEKVCEGRRKQVKGREGGKPVRTGNRQGGKSQVFPFDWDLEWEVGCGETGG